MASLKDVENKISAVKKTRQITKAMKMVATSRLRGAQAKMDGFRPYADKFAEVLGSLAEKAGDESSPLLMQRDEVKKIHIVLCTSDRGLCGGFNNNLTAEAKKFIKDLEEDTVEVSFTNFGKNGLNWCKKNNLLVEDEHIGVIGTNFGFNVASTAGRKLVDKFVAGEYDEVYIIYSQFISMAKQMPVTKQLLPIPPIESAEEENADESEDFLAEHICEPSPEKLLGDLLPRNVFVQIFSALLETSTSGFAAQMSAMENATNACNDIIDNLTMAYNRARQAAITAELMDIVGGAEALKG